MQRDYLGFEEGLQRQYGDLACMRLAQERAWTLMSPDLVREALVGQHAHLIRWERGIEVFSRALGRNVLTTEGATWQRQRRMLMPAFAPRRMAGYAQLMVQAGGQAIDAVLAQAPGPRPVAMDALWNRAAMDVILRVLFSSTAAADESRRMADATATLSAAGYREMFWPVLLPPALERWLPLPSLRAKRRALAQLRALIDGEIDRRMGLRPPPAAAPAGTDPSQPADLLAELLALRDNGEAADGAPVGEPGDAADSPPTTGQALSRQELFDQCLVSFQAGHETTATALLWWSWLMATHPEAQQRAQAEVDAQLAGRAPGADDLARLPWLQATLKEALRLYPPVAVLMGRRVTQPIRLGPWTVPVGHMLRITPWLLHRDERLWPQAQAFRPERFLDGAPPIPRGAWLPFGTGPRVCLGQHFAQLEMGLLAVLLLQRATLHTQPGEPPPVPRQQVTLRPERALVLRLLPR